jgi:nucleotide-binding universal stress UspA family protein
MYRHILVSVDCSDESRRVAERLAAIVCPNPVCQVTLVTTYTPASDPVIQAHNLQHARAAAKEISDVLFDYGVIAWRRVLGAKNPAQAIAEESQRDLQYDLIVVGTHQARPEIDGEFCHAPLAAQISERTNIPVMILSDRRETR